MTRRKKGVRGVRVWVSSDRTGPLTGCDFLSTEKPVLDANGFFDSGWSHGIVKPGKCREYMLVPVAKRGRR
jgi:hypothetical protein